MPAALVVLWNTAIYFDSSAVTAGTVQAADKELRGATMGLHSMCGYAGGFVDRSASGWSLIGREARRVGAWRSAISP